MPKPSKQKCIEMWEWLAKNPGKSKENYKEHLDNLGIVDEYKACWACYEANTHEGEEDSIRLCKSCPIKLWAKESSKGISIPCTKGKSPYRIWDHFDNIIAGFLPGEFIPKKQQKAALKMIELIKESWED